MVPTLSRQHSSPLPLPILEVRDCVMTMFIVHSLSKLTHTKPTAVTGVTAHLGKAKAKQNTFVVETGMGYT